MLIQYLILLAEPDDPPLFFYAAARYTR